MVVDAGGIGQRIADARGRAGYTQAQLASAISLDRSALAKIEAGQRRVSALELARLADALDVRVEWFLQDAPPAIISRRSAQEPGTPSPRIDSLVERITRSVEFVAEHDDRFAIPTVETQPVPTTNVEADALAETARALLGMDRDEPCVHLDQKVAGIGLYAFSFGLGFESADAATIALDRGGVAVINGEQRVGRRRLALAHELCHYLVADDYTVDWRVAEHQASERREGLFDRFARALLLPESGVRDTWESYASDGDRRGAAVRIASEYRVDMATLAYRLHEIGVLGQADSVKVRSIRTTRADIVEMNLVVGEELNPPTLPREYVLAVLRLYRTETVSLERALDLLLDAWDRDAMPTLPKRGENEIWQFV
ncbi:XRE family transcriptional regulator [Actinophytocola sp.]|uniref:helix-turn-helix domain-containing protein n=1 Tax=Actinophytocola sp. TaxID=1872138 RepID=UPI002ED4796E